MRFWAGFLIVLGMLCLGVTSVTFAKGIVGVVTHTGDYRITFLGGVLGLFAVLCFSLALPMLSSGGGWKVRDPWRRGFKWWYAWRDRAGWRRGTRQLKRLYRKNDRKYRRRVRTNRRHTNPGR